MQRRAFAIALISTAVLAGVAWAADFSGTWTGDLSTENGTFSVTYVFKQDGGKLTGTVQSSRGDQYDILEGKVNADQISFYIKVDRNGGMKFSSQGTIHGDELTLETKSEGGDMDFKSTVTLRRQK